jgi:hypothetical protein
VLIPVGGQAEQDSDDISPANQEHNDNDDDDQAKRTATDPDVVGEQW